MTKEHETKSFLLYVRNVSKEPAGGLAREMEDVLLPLWVDGLRWRRLEVELFVGRYEWTSAGENEAIYFPSGHWHVGVSERFSVSLDLALYGCDVDITHE